VWSQHVGENLAVSNGSVRIYYPQVDKKADLKTAAPFYTVGEINSWQWANQYGKLAFAIFLKDILSDYAATKPMDWGSCLFEPEMRSRITELRREQLANLPDTEYVKLLEEESNALASLKKKLTEKEYEIKKLEQERFELKQRIEYQYRPQVIEAEESVLSVLISSFAHGQLEKLSGKQYEQITKMLDNVSDEMWRQSHSHRFSKTDLKVFKEGQTNPAWIAGFFKDGQFCCTHIFSMQHNDYERQLNTCKQRDVENLEFISWNHK
jgi:succinate dehydrogenase flavin-adding protein (antitoxin of CptAB toxin-antitoxin module)